MGELAEELKAAAEAKQREGKPVRYRAELRKRAVEYLRERERAGTTMTVVSRELGVRWQTLRRWARREEKAVRVEPRAGFRQVRVELGAASGPTRWVRVFGPCGLRIEGLTVMELVTVLRALSTPRP
jgi:hypothetical protein